MRKWFKKTSTLLLALVLAAPVTCVTSQAAESITFTLSEDKTELTLSTGEVYTTKDFKTYKYKNKRITTDGTTYTDKQGNIYELYVEKEIEVEEPLTEWPTLIEVIGRNGLMHFDLDQIPIIMGTRTLLPLKHVVDSFGARAEISPQDKSITVKAGDKTLVFNIDSAKYTVNEVEKEMDTAPYIANNRVYVPVRYAFEVFDEDVLWNNKSASVYVDIDVTNVADYINYYYTTSVGTVSSRSSYDSGLNVKGGELSKNTSGSVIELYVPYGNSEAIATDIKYVLSGLDLDGKNDLMTYIEAVKKPKETRTVGNTTYKFIKNLDKGVYVKIYVNNATADKYPVTIKNADEVLKEVSYTAYRHYDNTYAELGALCEAVGIELTSGIYENKLTFDDGTLINICEGLVRKNGVTEKLGGTLFVHENLLYIDLEVFNKIFGYELTWEK